MHRICLLEGNSNRLNNIDPYCRLPSAVTGPPTALDAVT